MSIVYGAQHPPSLKAIQDINESTKGGPSKKMIKNFSEFEKTTNDAWDIGDEENGDLEHEFSATFKISIEESDKALKKVIKEHSEKNKQQTGSTVVHHSHLLGPGKALRQEANVNAAENEALKTRLSNIRHDSVSSSTPHSPEAKPQQLPQTQKPLQSNSAASNSIYNSATGQSNVKNDMEKVNLEKFKKILSANPVNLEELQKVSWTGITKSCRPISWKILSDYLPLKVELQEQTIEQKRNGYWDAVNQFYDKTFLEGHYDILRQILNDIPRMNPLMPIFQQKIVQDIFQRILYVWSVRHPATGYVQGINDLVTPFFAVFITEYLDPNKSTDIENFDISTLSEKDVRQLEADCFGCLTKLLDRIQENYVFSQPGIQKNVNALEELIKRMDEKLYKHLKQNNIEFLQFAFRWMNNLLMREIPLQCTIRLWDTYHAEPFGFSDFHLYVCAAFLLKFSKEILKQKDFQDLMLYLQNLPTRTWTSDDVVLLTAEAYRLQVMFANAPKHTKKSNNGFS